MMPTPLSQLSLFPRFHEVLKAISDYIEEFGRPPYRTNAWLSERTGFQSNHITQIKRDLVKLKLITENTDLTPKGREYIRTHFGPFVVKGVSIRVQGKVFAGPSEASINLDNLKLPSTKIINVPSLSNQDVFALRVEGVSMVQEGILEGDYVIVEKQDSLWWPEPQDMIVTMYLPASKKDLEFVGPVLKIYLKRDGERGCELGWRRANDTNIYKIKARALQPIGKVIGVYREI
jgi:SOS-response transcriptional repressor LexA